MKFKKVVFVRYFPLTKAIYTDLYFEELLQNNIQVDYLDLSALFFPDIATSDSLEFSGNIKINSYVQLKSYLKTQNNGDILYISLMTFEGRVFKLHLIFTKFKLNIAVFGRGVFPVTATNKKSEITRILKAISFKRIAVFIANRAAVLSKKWGYVKPYDYIFKAGDYGYYGSGMGCEIDYKKAKITEVNTVDYDQFLLHKAQICNAKNDYIVFLDQYLPHHPDLSYFNIRTVAPEPYFKEVNNFFDKLEALTGQKVIIAAHPKAERYKEFNPYNNRLVLFNQSNDLVKGASLVLTHASTAICFAICYKKKIALMVSEYLNEALPHFLVVAKSIEQACGATIIAIDKENDIRIPDHIDIEKYADFKYKYLTSRKSENQLSKDIFVNFLKNNDVGTGQ